MAYQTLSRKILTTLFLSLIVILSACSHENHQSNNDNSNVVGAGASFPHLIYSSWSSTYYQRTNKRINYQSIGSSAGLKQLTSGTIDFAGTDIPLSTQKLLDKNYFQFPTIIGGVVLIINLEGISTNQLILSGSVIADIYQGVIKKWNDPAIQRLNPNLKLPNRPITVVHRSDGSGTTYIFTQYLSAVSPSWSDQMGSGSSVSWNVGIGGKGNDGVAVAVKTLKNSIGYVEYAYASQNHLTYTKLINQSNHAIAATPQSFSLATDGRNWRESFSQSLINGSNPDAWPITSTTYIVIPKNIKEPQKTEILSFFDWGFNEEGSTIVKNLDYVPLPSLLTQLIRQQWYRELDYQPVNDSLHHEK